MNPVFGQPTRNYGASPAVAGLHALQRQQGRPQQPDFTSFLDRIRPPAQSPFSQFTSNLGAASPSAPPQGFGEQDYGFEDTVTGALPPQAASPYGGYQGYQGYQGYTPGAHGYRQGGEVQLDGGSFVVDAKTVSELGNGSSSAGQEQLARMGGVPITGPGDGTSDSIPAVIGGQQGARVARDEVYMPPEAVAKIGGGSHKHGIEKLYALIDGAHKARRKSRPGSDSELKV
jgi:hypothetical protein